METKLCAIYARVSSQEQADKDLSIPAQLKALRSYAARKGWEIVEEFIDAGASARTDDRPQFQRMIALAKKKPKPFDAILIHKTDRFARNREDAIIYKSLLRRECDIDVISITEQFDDSPTGKLLEGIMEVMAEFYSLNLAQEVQKGMKEKARQGKALGETPLGYTIGEDGALAIVPEEAEVVRYIFDQYIHTDKGLRAIAFDLHQNGARLFGKAGTKYNWSNIGIRKILTNPVYTGKFVWNRRDNARNGKMRDKDDWIIVDNAHPAIIDQETFEEAQRILASKRTRRRKSPDYLLRGLVRCMDCGTSMGQFFYRWKRQDGTMMERPMLRCHNYMHTGECYFNNVSQEEVENGIFQFLQELADGSIAYEDLDIVFTENNDVKQRIARLEKQLKDIEPKFDRQMQAFEAGIISLDQLKQFKERLEKERAELETELRELSDSLNQSAANASLLRRKVQEVLSVANNPKTSLRERQKALATVIDHVEYSKRQDLLKIVFRL